MNLNKFNDLAFSSATEAKDFINLLINFFPKNEDKGNAILLAYNSFSDSIKKEKELFSLVFYKFFLFYKINENNFGYYQEFSKKWSDSEKEEIKIRNHEWTFPKVLFDSPTELVKSLSKYYNEDFATINNFLIENEKDISQFINKDKNKFNHIMLENDGWKLLLIKNFDCFNHFCEKYNYDKFKIIKLLIVHPIGLKKYIIGEKIDLKTIEFILDNIKDIFKGTDFFIYQNEVDFYNIADLFLIFVIKEKHELAFKIYAQHKQKLNKCLYEFMYYFGFDMDIKKGNIENEKTCSELIKILSRVWSYNPQHFSNNKIAVKPFSQVISAINAIPKMIKYQHLNSSLSTTYIKEKHKIKI